MADLKDLGVSMFGDRDPAASMDHLSMLPFHWCFNVAGEFMYFVANKTI